MSAVSDNDVAVETCMDQFYYRYWREVYCPDNNPRYPAILQNKKIWGIRSHAWSFTFVKDKDKADLADTLLASDGCSLLRAAICYVNNKHVTIIQIILSINMWHE